MPRRKYNHENCQFKNLTNFTEKKMKNILYTLLSLSLIFSACKKEDDSPNNREAKNDRRYGHRKINQYKF